MKPVELMNDAEREEYYLTRRKAILAGDKGVLPDGKTCAEARREYIKQCEADPFRTRPGVAVTSEEAAADILAESEFPVGQIVAPELESAESDPDIANKRCC
jgi:hypothetical protein